MRVAVRTVSLALLLVALGAAGASWFTPRPELEAADAAEVAIEALAAAGFDGEVAEEPTLGVHDSESGDTFDAWTVFVDVPVDGTAERVELRVRQSAGQLVYVDDRIGPDGSERLLTEQQFQAIGRYEDDSLTNRWMLRNGVGSVSAGAIAVTCFALARRPEVLWRTV